MPDASTANDATLPSAIVDADYAPVVKTIRVRANAERAFRVFAEEMDSWWPRTHHAGASPLKRVIVEPRVGGAIASDQEDGTSFAWATVSVWDPPKRFAFAWHLGENYTYEPDASKCSEVEVNFTPQSDGSTLVTLEHRNFHRHAGDWVKMRESVGSEGGWGVVLANFGAKADEAA